MECSGPGAFLDHQGFCISSGCFTQCACDPKANSYIARDTCFCNEGFEEKSGECVIIGTRVAKIALFLTEI